jgi:hypothetical protein
MFGTLGVLVVGWIVPNWGTGTSAGAFAHRIRPGVPRPVMDNDFIS